VIQTFINTSYVKILGLDMSEFKDPSHYESLNDLFTRALIVKRSVDHSLDSFISPTASFVTQCGDIQEETVLQIKGMEYNLKELLSDEIAYDNFEKIKNGTYMNLYLSPKDYHRYHSPYNCHITKLIHIPGKLYPVNFSYLNKKQELFIENERVVVECKTTDEKLFYMVFVGALNVGKMVFHFEPAVNTNSKEMVHPKVYKYDDLYIQKGEELGYFQMGSTVLLFWEKELVELENLINTKVKFTDTIAKVG
jgi:phosphatidylserine decarboxylase